ncbi:MAG: hypothetical protein Q4G18_06595 [Myroides sp.]|nr:hypothetical protein [Myroides sp.]
MVVNNTSVPMNGAIRLHNKYNDPNPELGDIPLAIPAYGNIWINNGSGPDVIPFSALNNTAASFYTPTLNAHFSPGMGTNYTQAVGLFIVNDFKWSCIKTDILGYFDFLTLPNSSGYIQITPPYNPSMGGYVATSWPGYVALNSTGEVFENNYGYDYNEGAYALDTTSPNNPAGMSFVEITSGNSPFGGYVVMVAVS